MSAWFVQPPDRWTPGWRSWSRLSNGGNWAGRAGFAEELSSRGLAVLLMDYRGYGGNPGRPSEHGLAADADAAVVALEELGYAAADRLFRRVFGLGRGCGAPARHPPAGMVLRSPFTELADVGAHHYPWLPVRATAPRPVPRGGALTREVPITVIYGDHDSSPVLSARVADHAPPWSTVVMPGADHNDPVCSGTEWPTVARLAQA